MLTIDIVAFSELSLISILNLPLLGLGASMISLDLWV